MILIDTHVLLWWKTEDRRLSSSAKRALARARRVQVSPLTFWELAVLVRRRRINLKPGLFEWIRSVLGDERIDVAPLTATAAASAGMIGRSFGGDIADRLLYATARELEIPLVTKDEAIREFARSSGDVQTIW